MAVPGQGDIAFQEALYTDPNPTRRGLHLARRDWIEAQIDDRLHAGDDVLEVGVGCGIFTRMLVDRGAVVTAVDINPSFLEGVEGLDSVRTMLADATDDVPLPRHDLAVCSEVLEHVPRDGSVGLLRTLHDAIEPGGRLILTTPQRWSVVELMARLLNVGPFLAIARRLYGNADELGHVNLLTRAQLRRQLDEAGLVVEDSALFGFYLPVVAEFGGSAGQRLLVRIGRLAAAVPVLRGLLWTQAYVLRRA